MSTNDTLRRNRNLQSKSKTSGGPPPKALRAVRFTIRNFLVIVVALAFLLSSYHLVDRLYELQVEKYQEKSEEAADLHWGTFTQTPQRGDIFDSNGNLLVGTTYTYDVGVTPAAVKSGISIEDGGISKAEINGWLIYLLDLDPDEHMTNMSHLEKPYVQLKRDVDSKTADALKAVIKEYKIEGIRLDPVPKRYYVNGSLASHILGHASAQDGATLSGILGVEAQYNEDLTGSPGKTYAELSRGGNNVLSYHEPLVEEAVDGNNLILHIDKTIQEFAEAECKQIFEAYETRGSVTAIVMDVHTGAILANANYPDFNCNSPYERPYFVTDAEWDVLIDRERIDKAWQEEMDQLLLTEEQKDEAKDLKKKQDEDDKRNPIGYRTRIEFIMDRTWKNHAISGAIEPGSTMKALTTVMALEENLTYESEMFSDAAIGNKLEDGYSFRCSLETSQGVNHGTETLRQAFANSCNPIFVTLTQRIGIRHFYEYIGNFGFLDYTGIDLPSEQRGVVIPYSDDQKAGPNLIDAQSLSIGESAIVTPMQLITAYVALANGGKLMVPQVAKALVNEKGDVIREFSPMVRRTLFSENTAARIRSLMEEVMTTGTARNAAIPGYSIAGKTGTSTIGGLEETSNNRDDGLHVLTFGAYAPAKNPEIAVLIVVDRPEDKAVGSSSASIPASRLIEKTLSYLGVDRTYKNDEEKQSLLTTYKVPDVTGMTVAEAKKLLFIQQFSALDGEVIADENAVVTGTYPVAGTSVYKNGKVALFVSEEAKPLDTVIPDFQGQTLEEVLFTATKSRLNVEIVGDIHGIAVSQGLVRDLAADDGDLTDGEEPSELSSVERRARVGATIRITLA